MVVGWSRRPLGVRSRWNHAMHCGTGAVPCSTWPRDEVVIDVLHEAVHSVAAGLVAEQLIRPDLQSRRGRRSHRARRAADVRCRRNGGPR